MLPICQMLVFWVNPPAFMDSRLCASSLHLLTAINALPFTTFIYIVPTPAAHSIQDLSCSLVEDVRVDEFTGDELMVLGIFKGIFSHVLLDCTLSACAWVSLMAH